MNFMHLYHEPQHHGRRGLMKKMVFYFYMITQNISSVSNHTALLADLSIQVLLYLGGCGVKTPFSYAPVHICICTPFYTFIYLHILRKTLEVLQKYKPELSFLAACLYPWEINCILLLLCIVLFPYPSVCFNLPDCTVKTRKSIKGLLQ